MSGSNDKSVDDPVLRLVGYVFGAFGALALLAMVLLPYIPLLYDPPRAAWAVLATVFGNLALLVGAGVLFARAGAAAREMPGWFLRTHRVVLFSLIYVFLGGFPVMLVALGSPGVGWTLLGVLVVASLVFAWRNYRCPACRRLFAAELIESLSLGTSTGYASMRDASGMTVTGQTVRHNSRSTWRCRFCLHTWTGTTSG